MPLTPPRETTREDTLFGDLRRLGRAIKASLKGYRRRRVEKAGKAVEALLGEDPPNAKEAWRGGEVCVL